MPSFSRLHCEDHDIAVVVIPDSPLAVRAVNSQPKENLAFRYHGENHQILEVLGQDDSPEDLYALGHASKIIVLRGKKALYTFGSAVDCNVRLAFPDASPKQLEMILQYGQTGVDIQYLDNKTRLNGKPVRAGTEHLSVEACIRIGHADFRVIPTSSLVPGCKTYQMNRTLHTALRSRHLLQNSGKESWSARAVRGQCTGIVLQTQNSSLW